MKKLLACIVLFAVLLTGCSAGQTPKAKVVDVFSWQEIKNNLTVQAPTGSMTDQQKETKSLQKIDTQVRALNINTATFKNNGFVMIVEVVRSQNHLYVNTTEKPWEKLSPDKVYNEFKSVPEVTSSSFVRTTVRIKEVLYQNDGTSFTAGNEADIFEAYCVLDGRVPNLVSKNSVAKNVSDGRSNGWCPLEAGETYIIFGANQQFTGSNNPYPVRNVPSSYGIYCLSDLTKQAGAWKDAETLADGIAYLKQNYDLSKYGLK